MNDAPTKRSIIEGTLAQLLGGAIGVFAATTLASFDIYMKAGWESSFGTIMSIFFYLGWKNLRRR